MEIKVNNTFFTGKFLLHLPSVDSTNNYAKNYIANSSPIDGTVILADEQWAGRGQAGNVWQSDANKNLTFSIIYQTAFLKATEQFWLNMAVSLGIWSFVNSRQLAIKDQPLTVKIKWPNDILVNDRKIAGILIENTIVGMHLKYSIIGIGLNVNQEEFPSDINATSLKLESEDEININKILEAVLISIEKYYLMLKERKFERLKKEYIESLYRYNMISKYKNDSEIFEGKIIDIDDIGNILIETKDGRLKFGFKEISYII